jgi:uncharacterized protein YegL
MFFQSRLRGDQLSLLLWHTTDNHNQKGEITMNQDLTELVFILDRSGSMSGLEDDTIGGFNAMIEKQRRLDGQAIVSTVLFDHEVEILHDRIDLKEITPMTTDQYFTRGSTSLLDAVGRAIRHIKLVYAETLKEERPAHVVFVITTDGMENSSTEYTYPKVKRLIEEVQSKYNWEFLFLGANMDAIQEAGRFGIRAERAVRYRADSRGTQTNYNAINEAVTSVRVNNRVMDTWKKKVEDDYQKDPKE